MSYIYGRRYNNYYGKNSINSTSSKVVNRIEGTTLNPYQSRTSNFNNHKSYYSSTKVSPSKKTPYNRPSFNYGNLPTATKYKSVKKNGGDPLISNSYNIINNFNAKKIPQSNYNKYSSMKNDNITNLLNYENKKKEKEQFYFSNKGGNNYNNDYKQN